jgi:hypothetical protein
MKLREVVEWVVYLRRWTIYMGSGMGSIKIDKEEVENVGFKVQNQKI